MQRIIKTILYTSHTLIVGMRAFDQSDVAMHSHHLANQRKPSRLSATLRLTVVSLEVTARFASVTVEEEEKSEEHSDMF